MVLHADVGLVPTKVMSMSDGDWDPEVQMTITMSILAGRAETGRL